MEHEIRLSADAFAELLSGQKKLECMLDYDQNLITSALTVINSVSGEKTRAKICFFRKASTFSDLRTILMSEGRIAYKDIDPVALVNKYGKENMYKYGVIGFFFYNAENEIRKEESKKAFEADAPAIVASYVLKAKEIEIRTAHPEHKYWVCGTAAQREIKFITRRLLRIFSMNAVSSMAAYIQVLNEEITPEKYELLQREYDLLPEDDSEYLLYVAREMKYPISSIHRSLSGEFLDYGDHEPE